MPTGIDDENLTAHFGKLVDKGLACFNGHIVFCTHAAADKTGGGVSLGKVQNGAADMCVHFVYCIIETALYDTHVNFRRCED